MISIVEDVRTQLLKQKIMYLTRLDTGVLLQLSIPKCRACAQEEMC